MFDLETSHYYMWFPTGGRLSRPPFFRIPAPHRIPVNYPIKNVWMLTNSPDDLLNHNMVFPHNEEELQPQS
jgi:hypothetical protein